MRNEKGKVGIVILIFLLIIILACLGVFIWYNSSLKSVRKESEKVEVIIDEGTGIAGIAQLLEEKELIKNATVFKIYCKLNNKKNMQAGKYELDKNMSVEQIINELEKGNIVDESVTLTFVEGKRMPYIVDIITKNTDNNEEEIYALLRDTKYINSLIDKYWFVTKNVKDSDIYYSLEGYLYPDTYTYENKSVTTEAIFEKMLDKMEKELEPYKDEILDGDYSIHEILTLASIVELEAHNDQDRAGVAGVLYNRLDNNMALQSDVTTYYAVQAEMSERDLTASDLATKSPYNTRAAGMNGKIPVGPICSVSLSAIKAVIEPEQSNYLFFVADSNGKVYFARTNSEHEALINKLKNQGMWNTYED